MADDGICSKLQKIQWNPLEKKKDNHNLNVKIDMEASKSGYWVCYFEYRKAVILWADLLLERNIKQWRFEMTSLQIE